MNEKYELEVIDAAERPDLAEAEGIIATPTVIRLAPLPRVRVIGDLSDRDESVASLGLSLPPDDLSTERTS